AEFTNRLLTAAGGDPRLRLPGGDQPDAGGDKALRRLLPRCERRGGSAGAVSPRGAGGAITAGKGDGARGCGVCARAPYLAPPAGAAGSGGGCVRGAFRGDRR